MKLKQNGKIWSLRGLQLIATGICTGLLAGLVVTFYNIAANIITDYSKSLYQKITENPAFIPLLFVVLALSAFAIGTLVYFIPMIRGSGIPQTEGASRGLIHMKWYQVLPAMAAASLYCMFCGLSAGAEGPSIFIGGVCGDGMSRLLGCSDMERRYQITGGACTGLAVAFNAPLTGIVFAFEEAHRRFTPSIFICAFSSVISGLITRNLLFMALKMPIESVFSSYAFAQIPLNGYLYVAVAAIISALFGIVFYKLGFLFRRLLSKLTKFKGTLRMLVPFLFAGAVGLITIYAMGGGHTLIEAIGTHGGLSEISFKTWFSSPIVVTLLIILVLRLLSTTLNLGAGVPSGIFIPMLALGACIGALASRLCCVMGMDKVYCDCIVMISMAAFFTVIVKAPLTAIIMVVELTWQFTMLLPVILGVAIGYLISGIFRTRPLYDVLLESIMEDEHVTLKRHTYATTIEEGAVAAGQAIRDILWPGNLLIRSVKRDGVAIVPSSDTVLLAGDEISAQAETTSYDTLKRCVDEIVKPRTNTLWLAIKKLSGKLRRKNVASAEAQMPEVTPTVDEITENNKDENKKVE